MSREKIYFIRVKKTRGKNRREEKSRDKNCFLANYNSIIIAETKVETG